MLKGSGQCSAEMRMLMIVSLKQNHAIKNHLNKLIKCRLSQLCLTQIEELECMWLILWYWI